MIAVRIVRRVRASAGGPHASRRARRHLAEGEPVIAAGVGGGAGARAARRAIQVVGNILRKEQEPEQIPPSTRERHVAGCTHACLALRPPARSRTLLTKLCHGTGQSRRN